MKRKLKERLDKGAISQDLYNEITKRWISTEDEGERKERSSDQKNEDHETSEKSSTVNVMGLGKFGDVYAKKLWVSGSVKVSGNIDVLEMKVSGAASVGCDVKVSSDLEIAGMLRTGGSIKADVIDINGVIESEGVDCNSIKINLGSTRGKIVTLHCDTVHISRQWRRFYSASIRIDEITCRTADLEGVKAKRIVGENVILGDGCDVDYVEASTLKLSENAVVRKKNVRNEEV